MWDPPSLHLHVAALLHQNRRPKLHDAIWVDCPRSHNKAYSHLNGRPPQSCSPMQDDAEACLPHDNLLLMHVTVHVITENLKEKIPLDDTQITGASTIHSIHHRCKSIASSTPAATLTFPRATEMVGATMATASITSLTVSARVGRPPLTRQRLSRCLAYGCPWTGGIGTLCTTHALATRYQRCCRRSSLLRRSRQSPMLKKE